MRVLLTGGAGFIGSCFLWKLNSIGITDVIVVDHLGRSEKWKNLVGKSYMDYHERESLLKLLESGGLDRHIDVVVHLGACTSTTETDAAYLMENNYRYSRTLAEWAVNQQKRFIYASSAATYGDGSHGYSDDDSTLPLYRPLNMYGYSKHLFDQWVVSNKLQQRFVGMKFFNVFGPNEYHKDDMRSVVHKGYEQIKSTGKIRLFKSYREEFADGEQQRDFVYVKDVVDMIEYFLKETSVSGIFNIGTGQANTWNQLAESIFSALGIPANIEYIEMPDYLREKYQYYTQADTAKLRRTGYDFPPTALEAAVKDYVGILEEAPGYL